MSCPAAVFVQILHWALFTLVSCFLCFTLHYSDRKDHGVGGDVSKLMQRKSGVRVDL